MGDLSELASALPQTVTSSVSLLDALPDPKESSIVVDYESRPSLLNSDPLAMSAAETYAVLSHQAEEHNSSGPRKRVKQSEPVERKKLERKSRGRQIKARTRGNQRSKIDKKKLDW